MQPGQRLHPGTPLRRAVLAPLPPLAAVLAFLLALLLVPAAAGGSAGDPELVDAEGDQDTQAGILVVPGTEEAFDDVDVVAAWFEQATVGGPLSIHFRFGAPPESGFQLDAAFKTEATPASLYTSVASGQSVTLSWTVDGNARTAQGMTAGEPSLNGETLVIPILTLPSAGGGDRLTNLTASTSRTQAGALPPPFNQDHQSGTDTAPDPGAGPSRDFVLPRVPVQAGVRLELLQWSGPAGTGAGTSPVSLSQADATLTYTAKVTNTGTDPDTYTLLAGTSNPEVVHVVAPRTLTLDPGASRDVTWTTDFNQAEGDVELNLAATSTRGASGVVTAQVRVDLPAAPKEREAKPAGLAFLTPVAEALGFDSAFGDYAELAVLALGILLLLLLLFLLFTLTRRPWVRVRVVPKTAVAPPGGTAEFRVAMQNRKRGARNALASFRALGAAWKAGLLLRQRQGPARAPVTHPGEEIEIELTGHLQEGDHYDGRLSVKVPETARSGDKARLELDVIPLDAHGEPRRAHMGRARVLVQASESAGAPRVRIEGVRHAPEEAAAGTPVRTTATVRNEGEAAASLRVVLTVDGEAAVEERIEVPPRASRAVVLPWTAGGGRNQVKVQVFAA